MAYIQIASITKTSFDFRLAGADTGYEANDRTVTWTLNGSVIRVQAIPPKVANTAWLSATNLQPGTQYTLGAEITNGNWTSNLSEWVTTEAAMPRPSDWNWTNSEYNAMNNNGGISALRIYRWNDFIDRINEFVAYVNSTKGRSVSPVPSYHYMGVDGRMYASSFNTIVGVIRDASLQSLSMIRTQSSGDLIYGYYLLYMADAINYIS